jgi:uncharacterized phage infection (PIP) family protein YhgE
LINLAADSGGVSPQKHQDRACLEPIEPDPWTEYVAEDRQHQIATAEIDPKSLPDRLHRSQSEGASHALASQDVKAELDSLLTSLQAATPHPPLASIDDESGSIASILNTIVTTTPVTHTQELLQELNDTRKQLKIARTELQVLHQRNQVQIDRADANMLQARQLKLRTQQLAQHSKQQIEKIRSMVDSLAQIRSEIVTSLDKFGGYEEIHTMLAQLETTRHALEIAHERVTTGQEAFYDSLQVIQQQVAARSYDSEQKLRQYQSSIQNLSETISIDRLRIAGMSVDLSTKINNLHDLNAQITWMHAQIADKSQTLQSRMNELDRGFGELSQSMRTEKDQFYELTVETIEKADAIRSQLAGIIKQASVDRDSIDRLAIEIESVRQDTDRQINDFSVSERELISICNDYQAREKDWTANANKFSRWLWILSVAVGVMFILSIRVLVSAK